LPSELLLAGSFALSLVAVLLLVPLAVRVALRTGFVDKPGGYKGHAKPTPYLGGSTVVIAVGAAVIVSGAATSRYAALLIWALVLFVVGTVDDRRNLNPLTRLVIEAGAAYALWHYGLGWAIFGNDIANIALTVFWVVGLVNAFNLMDNMDGAASSVAGASAAGIAALGVLYHDAALALIGVSVAGACLGFLRFNLAKPARIFLGDGGSMPIGFVVAGAVMAAPGAQGFGWSAVLAMAPMVGLPILDTTLVVISRRRGGRPVLSGGRDHLTHRLRADLGSARIVAASLAIVQIALCFSFIGLSQVGHLVATIAAGLFVIAGAFAIYTLETPGRGRLEAVARALPTDSVTPERSTA
jgi:UDP-GlcNAc:undecaprenyl-phosphate GlcNAc-1-phosphate transferase